MCHWRRLADLHNWTVLLRAGNVIVTTYTIPVCLAFAAGYSVSIWYHVMAGMDVAGISRDYFFVILPAIIIGTRTFSILLEWRSLRCQPLATIAKPGFMLHGGIAGGCIAFWALSPFRSVSLLQYLDAASFAMPLSEAIARIGCYVYGCCWGRPYNGRLGIRYTSADAKVIRCAPHLYNVKLHPVQLYAAFVYLAMFVLFRVLADRMPFAGALTGLYMILHPATRYGLERFRGDDRGRLWGGRLTHTNVYAALMIVTGMAILVYGAALNHVVSLDNSVRFRNVVFDTALLPWIILFGMIFGAVFGVHYRKTGFWIVTAK